MSGFRSDMARRMLADMTEAPDSSKAYVLKVVGRKQTQNLHLLLSPVQIEFFESLCHVSQMLHHHPDEPVLQLVESAQVEFDDSIPD